MKRFFSLVILSHVFSSCTSTQQGATIGAVVGVGAGAAIGGGGGAIIGGAVGAAGGAAIGAAIDDSDRDKLSSYPDTQKKIDKQKRLSKQDIVNMSHAGLSDETIIGQIQSTKSYFYLSNSDIIKLQNQGVSQSVIDAMIATRH